MDDKRLKTLLRFAEKYGADSAYLIAAGEDEIPGDNDARGIAELIDKGTRQIAQGESKHNGDSVIVVDPETNAIL